ncbi:MAG: Tol-Pal system beta propeller repeat protein TolB [Gammaproteobacteria bacterium]|jgi:TolB protein|nr:Tol-Pal system beta propeller repeat protein TolB [Gammaproteobacteria bacterium]
MVLRRLLLLVLTWLVSGGALAELKIEITRGQGEAVPIAVVPFGWTGDGAAPYDIAGVVANDLARSGRFQPIPERDMLQKPTTGAAIDFADWRILDTQVIVVGQILPVGADSFTLEFRVFDVFRGEQLLGFRMPSERDQLRATAHRISDMIFEKLTGIPGVAATRIAYVNVVGDPRQPVYRLVVADADGENARVMLESLQPIMSPAWSPDGRNLAYVSFENGGSQVFVQSLRSGARKRVSARRGINSAPSWSPDGKRLALTLSRGDGNLDVYTLEIATQVLTRLTDWPSIETEPNWSADGEQVYFTSDRTGGPQIYKIPAAGGRPERVTFEGSYNARPRVSPDGKRMVVVHNDRGNYRIAVVDLERAYLQILTDGNLDESPSFAPNGQVIIYAAREGARGVLSLVSVDGRVAQRVAATDGEVREPAWSPFPVN